MTKKTWIIFSVLCIAILGGLIAVSQGDKIDVSNVELNKVLTASEDSGNIADNVYGKKDSKVVLIEYGDYQCPGCASAHEPVKEVVEKYKDKIAFVFRNFPLVQIHANALAASSAAEAAAKQGKFWEMHDALFGSQEQWKNLGGTERTSYFEALAKDFELNIEKFSADLATEEVRQKIDFNQQLGKKAGVQGTPSFFVGGKNVGDQYAKDGKIVQKGTEGAELVWSNAEAFEKLVVLPALKEAGIATE